MTAKTAFSTDEWELLLMAPISTGMYILLINWSVMGFIKSAKALNDVISRTTKNSGNTELLNLILRDYKDRELMEQLASDLYGSDLEELKVDVLDIVKDAVSLLQEKATPAESSQIRQWIHDLALQTAQATKDGGFLGIGSVPLNEDESAFLADLSSVLKISLTQNRQAAK